MSALVQESRPLTYTPAVCAHLEDLRRSYVEQKEQALQRITACKETGDSEGVKIAQIDSTLAAQALNTVETHLALANREWTR